MELEARLVAVEEALRMLEQRLANLVAVIGHHQRLEQQAMEAMHMSLWRVMEGAGSAVAWDGVE